MNNRIYYMDAMRGILILLIVVIHSLQVFNPDSKWLLHSNNTVKFAPYIIEILMFFVLPSFFIISGFFAAMSISKSGIENFFDSKLKRILIPIFMAAITLNSLQTFLLIKNNWMKFELRNYITKGEWISHLWFLIDLAIFFFLLYISVKFFKLIVKKIINKIDIIFNKISIILFLFLFSFIIVILLILVSITSKYIYNEIINIHSIAYYLPFFMLGTLLYINKKILNKLLKIPFWNSLLIVIISLYFSNYLITLDGKLYKILYYFFNITAHVFSSVLCLLIFNKFMNKKSDLLLFLADASYTIYLFHHVVVVAIAILLIKLNIGGVYGLVVLITSSSIVSIIIHKTLILKINLLSFLYNGKVIKK